MAEERILPDDETERLHDIPDSRFGRRILDALRRIIRAVDIYSRRLAADHQITGPQLICLNTIVEQGPITATDLSHEVHLSPSTVVRILDRLEAKGLIDRQRQRNDRRRIHVTATIAGNELSARAPYSEHHPLRRALKQLPVGEQEQAANVLERLVALMAAGDLSAAPVLEVGSIRGSAPAETVLTSTEDEIEGGPSAATETAPDSLSSPRRETQ